MKKIILLLLLLALTGLANARTIEVDVHGMTCAFCVDSLERKFKDMDDVSNVEVSLKQNMVRLQAAEDSPSVEAIKQAVLDAGFTPVKIRVDDIEQK